MNHTLQQQQFANEMAEALNDRKSISQYLRLATMEDEAFLRETLMHVLSLPDHKITTSRAALFYHIVTSNAKSQGLRD